LKLKNIIAAAVLAAGACAQAQTTPASAPAAVSPAKKELVQKIVRLHQPGIDALARQIVEQPAFQLAQQAQAVMQQRVAGDKREALGRELQADLKKYVDETLPAVRERVSRVVPGVLSKLLEERYAEDELKTLLAWLESPVSQKYQQMLPEIQRVSFDKLRPEVSPLIEPKARALQQTISGRLGLPASAPASNASAPKKK